MRYVIANYPPFISPTSGQPMWQLPHNIFIEVAAELGYPGLFLFLVLVGTMLYTNFRTRKLAKKLPNGGKFAIGISHGLDAGLFGYLAAGFFVTVFYYPFFWISYALTVALHHVITNQAAAFQAPAPVILQRG
jgi:O-antigen ligase